jgi:hypothetical protein
MATRSKRAVQKRRRTKARRSAAPPGNVLEVSNLAHIGEANVAFGDLTILVGPQATGKSLILQLLKLAIDGREVAETMTRYGLVFSDEKQFLARYLGEGMENAWGSRTRVRWRGREIDLSDIARPRRGAHSVYFVPAHRTLILSEGYPPTFQQFRPETPFIVRYFSEEVRQVLLEGFRQEVLFPQDKRLKGRVREKINEAVFHDAELREDASGIQRQLKLSYGRNTQLSYMTWTAGQREFIPLLLGLYYLLPAGGMPKRSETEWVIIEEPEMGLHPKAIMSLMLLALDLLSRGYRVVISTHSPLVLDVVWALRVMKEHRAGWQPVLKLFGIEGVTKATARGEVEMAERALAKQYNVHLLDFEGRRVKAVDISPLDPGSEDPNIAGWGGLTRFSGRIGEVVAEVVAEHSRE